MVGVGDNRQKDNWGWVVVSQNGLLMISTMQIAVQSKPSFSLIHLQFVTLKSVGACVVDACFTYCQISWDTARYHQILPDTTRYHQAGDLSDAIHPQIWPDVTSAYVGKPFSL